MVIHGNSIVSNGEEKTCFFLLEKKAIRDLYLGSIKENTERERALESTVPHIEQKIWNYFLGIIEKLLPETTI